MYIYHLHRMKNLCMAFILSGLSGYLVSSCDNTLDVDSFHAASESQQWNALEDARAALMGVYGLARAALAENNGHWLYGDLRMGDFTVTSRKDLQTVKDNRLNYPNDLLDGLSNWSRFYRVINAATIFLERAPQIVDKDRSYSLQNLEYDKAQVRALRAFIYFYMVRIWGDVPLITQSYDNGSFPQFSRTDEATVLNYVKSELSDILEILPILYGTDNNLYYKEKNTVWKGVLFNKISALTLLAHISAWQGNYADVEAYATAAIGQSSQFQGAIFVPTVDLVKSNGFFSSADTKYAGSRLLAFPFVDKEKETTASGHLENLTLAYPIVHKSQPDIYITKDSLLSIFDEIGDARFTIDDSTTYVSSYIHNMYVDRPIFSKIKVIQDGEAETNDYAVFGSAIVFSRLEELMLLKAEALGVENKPEEAIILYNQVRALRNLPPATYKKNFGNDPRKVLMAIFEERRRELMGEGWRWFDKIRRERILGEDKQMRKLIEEGGIYWPISRKVLKENSQLVQNSYWK